MTVERLAVTHGPDAVLHNLKYCKLFVPNFNEVYDGHCGYVFITNYLILATVLLFYLLLMYLLLNPKLFLIHSNIKILIQYTLRVAASVIPEVVGEYSRWTTNTALLLMAIKLVNCIQY